MGFSKIQYHSQAEPHPIGGAAISDLSVGERDYNVCTLSHIDTRISK
jgi:hypothetical protein